MSVNKKRSNRVNNDIVAYKNYINMKKKEIDRITDDPEKEVVLIKDIIQKQEKLLKKYDEVLKKHGVNAHFSEERGYVIALKDILKKIKAIVKAGNDVPDVYYNEVEADIGSIYLWKEASKEEVIEIINSYDIYDVIAKNIPKRLLLDDDIY